MANVSSLISIWEKADSSYIQIAKSGERNPLSRKHFYEVKNERNEPGKEIQGAMSESEYDNASENGSQADFENFDAIPDEFRPSKQGKGLLKVRTTPKMVDSKEMMSPEEPHQNKRYPIQQNESSRKTHTRNSNSSAIRNEIRNSKTESLKTQQSEHSHRHIDGISDEQKSNEMFFYDCSSQNESSTKATRGRQQNYSGAINSPSESSEKSKLKNMQDESTQSKFFNSNSYQPKITKEFDKHSSYAQYKDDFDFPKSDKIPPLKFQDRNKTSFIEKDAQKITRETTVTKRIQWRSDLCTFKKPDNKPNVFYEYRKTTKQSMSYSSPKNEEDDEAPRKPYQAFKKERVFYSDFRRSGSLPHNFEPNHRYGNRNQTGFESSNKSERKETNRFAPERPQRVIYKFEEQHNRFQGCNGNDPIIIRHEIKVFHVNGRGRNNRRFHPSQKERNGKLSHTDDGHHSDMIKDKTGENTMAKKEEVLKKIEKICVEPPLKLTDSSPKVDYDYCDATSNDDFTENAAILRDQGREISDLIAGSYIAISVFLDNYKQWRDLRRVTMLLFEEFEKNLPQSCNKNKRIVEVAEMVGMGCKMVQYVPHPGVSIAAKVIACLSDVVLRMFSSSKSAKSIDMDDFQLRLCLQKDMEATSNIYACGLQCDTQFQETCKIIEEFHGNIKDGLFERFVDRFETGFLKEISLLNPKHQDVFYKRLERVYKLLNDRQQSEEGKAFCRAFEDFPDALSSISHLSRRFQTENWDSSRVLKAWEEIYDLLQNEQSVVEDLRKKIQDCICVLMREQSIMEKYVMDLQRRI